LDERGLFYRLQIPGLFSLLDRLNHPASAPPDHGF